jgi:hypothetical protein
MGVERWFFVVSYFVSFLFWYECLSDMAGPLVMQSGCVSSLYLCVFLFLIRILVFLNLALKTLRKRMLVWDSA